MSGRLLASACAALLSAVASAQTEVEQAVKAAYLYRLGFYVQWPSSAFSAPSSPVTVCISGDDPFGDVLDKAVSGQRINDRPVAVRRVKALGRDSGCHILYLGAADAQRVAQTLDAARGTPVLTVTDGARAPAVGVVNFVLRDDRVRFEIDDEAAAQNQLALSSKLLKLAVRVKPRNH